jgi:hypothetical protein
MTNYIFSYQASEIKNNFIESGALQIVNLIIARRASISIKNPNTHNNISRQGINLVFQMTLMPYGQRLIAVSLFY